MAVMPASLGVLGWPPDGRNVVALADEGELPFADYSIDRVLLVHALETSEEVRPMLKEIWRVLAGGGRLMVVAPNRRGIWARLDRTRLAQADRIRCRNCRNCCGTSSSPRSALTQRCSCRRPPVA